MDETLDITAEQALEHARTFLGGSWDQIETDNVELSIMKGGFSSRLYLCSNRVNEEKFLIRLHGGKLFDKKDFDEWIRLTPTHEALVYYKMGELGLGPKLYGAFEGGRIEQFIPSRVLEGSDLENPEIRNQLMKKLARYHGLDFPINRKPLINIEGGLDFYKQFDRAEFERFCKKINADGSWLSNFDMIPEFEWLKKNQSKIQNQIRYIHIDMNKLNCLIREEPDQFGELVTIIDYEAGSYGPRGYDLGSHWNMFLMDLSKPKFDSGLAYPDRQLRKSYCHDYLAEWSKIRTLDPEMDTVEHLQMEAEFNSLLGLTFMIFFVVMPKKEDSPLLDEKIGGNFLSISKKYIDNYLVLKQEFIDHYGSLLDL